MKNGKLTEKLVKFGIMAIGTLGSVLLASCIKSKDDPEVIECGAGDVEVTDASCEETPEEVTGGEEG